MYGAWFQEKDWENEWKAVMRQMLAITGQILVLQGKIKATVKEKVLLKIEFQEDSVRLLVEGEEVDWVNQTFRRLASKAFPALKLSEKKAEEKGRAAEGDPKPT